MPGIARRTFLAAGSAGLIGGAAVGRAEGRLIRASREDTPPDGLMHATSAQAREFVGACHFNIKRVREMLEQEPGLAKSSWDWGFGDWETAIGAASHVGRIEIIDELVGHGARPDVFTMATLDHVDAVRAYIEHVPGARSIEGPHSISLYRHAQAGRAERVKEYLASVGLDALPNQFETDQDAVTPLIGVFAFGGSPDERFEVTWAERFSCLSFKLAGGTGRNLRPQEPGLRSEPGERVFRPAGSDGALIVFEKLDRLRVEYNGAINSANRVPGGAG